MMRAGAAVTRPSISGTHRYRILRAIASRPVNVLELVSIEDNDLSHWPFWCGEDSCQMVVETAAQAAT